MGVPWFYCVKPSQFCGKIYCKQTWCNLVNYQFSICWFQTNFQNIFKIRWHPTQWWNFCPFLNIGALIAEIWKWTYKFKASTIAIICLDPKHSYKIPKISQLPCPSARKKNCLGQIKFVPDKIIFVLDKIFCRRLKSHDYSFCKTKELFSHHKSPFYSRKVIFRNFSRVKMDFLAMDKIFCPGQKKFVKDNLGFVLDKKYFVRPEGWGIRY